VTFLLNNPGVIARLTGQHIALTGGSLLIAIVIALPLGWLLYIRPRLAGPVLGVLGVIYTIPSIALIIFLIPFFGLNARSVMVALVLYCQVILVRNVLVGLQGIDPAVLEAARGMGMNDRQIALKVQFPLAVPVIVAGLRIAAVVSVAIATLGAKFGAGGLGTLLFDGIAQAGRPHRFSRLQARAFANAFCQR
jgi:osmoprotectant transport system permease protein